MLQPLGPMAGNIQGTGMRHHSVVTSALICERLPQLKIEANQTSTSFFNTLSSKKTAEIWAGRYTKTAAASAVAILAIGIKFLATGTIALLVSTNPLSLVLGALVLVFLFSAYKAHGEIDKHKQLRNDLKQNEEPLNNSINEFEQIIIKLEKAVMEMDPADHSKQAKKREESIKNLVKQMITINKQLRSLINPPNYKKDGPFDYLPVASQKGLENLQDNIKALVLTHNLT